MKRQQAEIEAGEHDPHAPADWRLGAGDGNVRALPADEESGEGAKKDDGDLRPRRRRKRGQDQRQNGDRRARPVRAEGLSHPHDGLGDNGDRDQLEAVHEPVADEAFERALAIGEQSHGRRRRQREPTQAARPPRYPARMSPTAKPVWLLAGPGRNCESATRSA